MLDGLDTHESIWNKVKTSYGVMCVTEFKVPIENGNCDYNLLFQLICAFYKLFSILKIVS